ncbi:MAG: rod shape-determining protein MreC [Candidatus Omnitrophica bacterium]|nr:rod shape-determining protein MreC [Candidatus Omnitrophota bacterium]MBU1925810.1 rod shape-determining protein MreC [Candidatus Omnitrophota bacterium]
MFKIRKILLLLPVFLLLLIVLIIPPQKLIHLKSNFSIIFRGPLRIAYQVYLYAKNSKKIFSLYSEFQRLSEENQSLLFEVNQLKEMELENLRLYKIVDFKSVLEYKFVAAKVIGKEPSNWLDSLIIDRGITDGIYLNQPVMNFAGVIGKIIEVDTETAKVLLISDINSRVVVKIQRTRQEGMLEGLGRGLCRLKYLPPDAELKTGDVVVTTGMGGVYPKGLVVGKVEGVRIKQGESYKSCIIRPEVPLSDIEEVLCLKSDSGQ